MVDLDASVVNEETANLTGSPMPSLVDSERLTTEKSEEEVEPPPKRRRGDEVVCEQCKQEPSKYTCPRCKFRSCSVECVRVHKEQRECSGEAEAQPPTLAWSPVPLLSKFTSDHSVDDQHFLSGVRDRFRSNGQVNKAPFKSLQSCRPARPVQSTDERRPAYSYATTSLIKNARQRRIWLKVKEEKDVGKSYHENLSDTILWSVQMRFVQSTTSDGQSNTLIQRPTSESTEEVKPAALLSLGMYESSDESTGPEASPVKSVQPVEEGELTDDDEKSVEPRESVVENEKEVNTAVEEGEVNEASRVESTTFDDDEVQVSTTPTALPSVTLQDLFVHEVNGIPETLRVCTLMRQFVRPRESAPLVTKSELDLAALASFIAAPDSYLLYLAVRVPDGSTKYYVVDRDVSLLENLRNRVIDGRPKLIAVMNSDPFDFAQPTTDELEALKAANQTAQLPTSFGPSRRPARGGHFNGPPRPFRPQRVGGEFRPISRPDPRPYRSDYHPNPPFRRPTNYVDRPHPSGPAFHHPPRHQFGPPRGTYANQRY